MLTQADTTRTKNDLRTEFVEFRAEIKTAFAELRAETRAESKSQTRLLLIILGTILAFFGSFAIFWLTIVTQPSDSASSVYFSTPPAIHSVMSNAAERYTLTINIVRDS